MASQLIVLHHFAAYGPLADALNEMVPRLSAWLYDYARMAVQVFLVLGGFLAARSLEPQLRQRSASPWLLIGQRYWRLVPAFVVALLLAIGSGELARSWITADFIPDSPDIGELLAHVFLLHSILDVDSLSAGVWYVAIDFQLFTLMTIVLWLGRGWAKAAVTAVMLSSLFYFNRNAGFDDWALYFFGAYGLGALAYWVAQSDKAALWLVALAGAVLLALAIDFRARIALALATALFLAWTQWRNQALRKKWHLPLALTEMLAALGGSSYALFLIHFSALMLGNALLTKLNTESGGIALSLMIASWMASIVLSLLFVRWIEQPLARIPQPWQTANTPKPPK